MNHGRNTEGAELPAQHAEEGMECLRDAIHILEMQDTRDVLRIARLVVRLGAARVGQHLTTEFEPLQHNRRTARCSG
jgi:hypothetical protein